MEKILASVSYRCDHGDHDDAVEIYAERGDLDEAPFYLTAMVQRNGKTQGFGIPMEATHLATFAWSILRELEGLPRCD